MEGDPEQAALAVGIEVGGSRQEIPDVRERRRQQRSVLDDPDGARPLGDEDPAVGSRRDHRRLGESGDDERVLEAARDAPGIRQTHEREHTDDCRPHVPGA